MSPPPGSVLPQAQLMARQHGWWGGQRQSAAMLLGQLQSQLHTQTHSHATVNLQSSVRHRQKQHADKQEKRESMAGREARDSGTSTVQKPTGAKLKI